ncbi:MAG: PIN domain-containing protein [Planctomycetia bacterium]|nr:PIN domain-containing protein [Planctomycetia bacterium]
MNIAFADTFYFIALLSRRDRAHAEAIEFDASYLGRIVTSDWVLLELADAFSAVDNRQRFATLFDFAAISEGYEVVRASDADFDAGLLLYRSRSDKEWSLTDCISFTIMHRLGLHDAITGDQHFAQAGFNILLPRIVP